MKRRSAIVALAIVPLVGLFLWAREAASWRPKTISKAQFEARLAPSFAITDGLEKAGLAAQNQRLKQLAKAKEWDFRGASPDGTRMLVQSPISDLAAIWDAQNGALITQMEPYPGSHSLHARWNDVRFSVDNRFVVYEQFGHTNTLVFDAQTGNYRWGANLPSRAISNFEQLRFSPTGRFVGLSRRSNGVSAKILKICVPLTGNLIDIPKPSVPATRWNFSRDDRYLLTEFPPGQYQQWRLR